MVGVGECVGGESMEFLGLVGIVMQSTYPHHVAVKSTTVNLLLSLCLLN
jgi:Ca2+/Na+ antiporter